MQHAAVCFFCFMAMARLVTPRLVAGEWHERHVGEFVGMNADARVMRYFPSTLDRDASEAFLARIKDEMERCGYGLWAVEERGSGRFVGFVGLHGFDFAVDFAPGVEVGWRLLPEFWGRGYAPEMAAECLRFAREELSLDRVWSFTALQNKPSEKVMQKAGMERVKEFDHPALPEGHPLRRHVLYCASLLR